MSRKLFQSTAIVSTMTLISRVMGFIRDMVFARFFGADAATDAFFVAFKIPNFLRRLFAEGAFSQAFVPVLSEYKSKRPHQEVQELVNRVSGTLGIILLVITLVGVVAAPILIMVFAPGFIDEKEKLDLAGDMLRLTFPYLLFISLTALAGGILNSYGRFAAPAFTPVLLNLCLIGMAIWIAPMMDRPIMALAWGVMLAGIVQLLFQLPFLWQLHLLPCPRWGIAHQGVKRILRLMLPAIFGSSVAQINLLFDTLIASLLVTGSVSWLYYSDRLVEFPLGVFGIALATVILPNLSGRHAAQDQRQFSLTLDWALRWVALVGLPAAIGLALLAEPVLMTLFQYDEFSPQDVHMSSLSLMAYSVGLLGFILVKVLAPGFYARQDTKTPVRIGIVAMFANMVLNVVLVVPMVMLGVQGPHAGLALATALGSYVNAGLLFKRLRSLGIYKPEPGWMWLSLRILMAGIALGSFLMIFSGATTLWIEAHAWQRVLRLAALVFGGAVVYIAVILAFGIRPWRWVVQRG